MRCAPDFLEPHRPERRLILHQFHPRFQLQRGQMQDPRPLLGQVDQLQRQPLTAMARRDRQLADIQHRGFRGEEDASDRRTDHPDFAQLRLPGQRLGRQIAQRRRRVDPALHIGEGFVQKRKDRGPEGWVDGKLRCHRARLSQRTPASNPATSWG